MRRWLRRGREKQPYEAVPRLDLLSGRRSKRRVYLVGRGVLALLLVGGVFFLQDQYYAATALQEDVAGAETRLAGVYEELGAAQREVEELSRQVQQLRDAGTSSGPVQFRWKPALAALEGLQGESVTFRSLEGDSNGVLTLVAAAPDGAPLARLQASLQEAGLPFTLRTVQWERQQGETVMTATLRLQEEP